MGFASVFVSLRVCGYICLHLRPYVCVCVGVCVRVCVHLQVCVRARVVAVHVLTCVGMWTRVCGLFSKCTTMPDFRQLGKNTKIANNSLANKDKIKFFSVHELHTKSFLYSKERLSYLNLPYTFYGVSILSIGRKMPTMATLTPLSSKKYAIRTIYVKLI